MILNGILIRKISGLANTEGSYITVNEKYFSLESKLTSGTLISLIQDHRLHTYFFFSLIEILYSVTTMGFFCNINSENPFRQAL